MIERAKAIADYISGRATAFRLTFSYSYPHSRAVLVALAKFCHASETCATKDQARTWRLEGRREVWLFIQRHVHLTDEQLQQLFTEGNSNG